MSKMLKRAAGVLIGAMALLGLATTGFAEPEIQIHSNNATVPIGGHLEIELEYETGTQPVDVYAVLFLTDGSFFSFVGVGQFGPINTLIPLATSVTSPRVNLKLLDIEPLPSVPLGGYALAAGLALAGQPPLTPGNLVVSSVGNFEVSAGGGGGGGGGGSGCGSTGDESDDDGLEVEVTSRITELVPPAHFRLASGHCFQVYGLTEYRAPLNGYGSLSVNMRVEAEGHQQQDGDVLAKKVQLED